MASPFLKWAGGKRKLASAIVEHFPATFTRYFEPFLGGGAVFFHLEEAGRVGAGKGQPRAFLADANRRLVDAWQGVQADPLTIVSDLSMLPCDETTYLDVRSKPPSASESLVARAVWTIYMNKACFNGLWRVNGSGVFNVPYGKNDRPHVCDAEAIMASHRALHCASIGCAKFEDVIAMAGVGDVVYCDPPYLPASATANFASYTEDGFGPVETKRLAQLGIEAAGRGAHIVMSNADTPAVREIFSGYEMHEVQAARAINSKGSGRGKVGELILVRRP